MQPMQLTPIPGVTKTPTGIIPVIDGVAPAGKSLTPGVYRLVKAETGNSYMLHRVHDKFNTIKFSSDDRNQHIINLTLGHFYETNGSLGAYFSGTKGTGKTAIAENIANELIEGKKKPGMACILCDHSVPADVLMRFCRIGNVVFIFDEFENNFNNYQNAGNQRPNQQIFLTILSDRNIENTLFIFIDNGKMDKADALLQRPERILISVEFKAPGGAEFLKLMKDVEDVSEEVKTYFAAVFDSSTNHGYDSLLACKKAITGVKTLHEALDIVSMINIPRGYRRTLTITEVIKKEGSVPIAAGKRDNMVAYRPFGEPYKLLHPTALSSFTTPADSFVERSFNYEEIKTKYSPNSFTAHSIVVEDPDFIYTLSLTLSRPRENDSTDMASLAVRDSHDFVIYRRETAEQMQNGGERSWF